MDVPQRIVTVYQRSAALLQTHGVTQFADADYLPLTEGSGLYLPHNGRLIADTEDQPGFQPVRSVLATTSSGFGVLITHGDNPSDDGRVFYFPPESVRLTQAIPQCVEENNPEAVTAWVNATELSPLQQAATDPSAILQDNLEQLLDRPGPVEASNLVWTIRNGPEIIDRSAANLAKPFVLTEDRNPELYYAQNPELHYERRQHFLTKAALMASLTVTGVTVAFNNVSGALLAAHLGQSATLELGLAAVASIAAVASGVGAGVYLKDARRMKPLDPRSNGFLPGYGGAPALPRPRGGASQGR